MRNARFVRNVLVLLGLAVTAFGGVMRSSAAPQELSVSEAMPVSNMAGMAGMPGDSRCCLGGSLCQGALCVTAAPPDAGAVPAFSDFGAGSRSIAYVGAVVPLQTLARLFRPPRA